MEEDRISFCLGGIGGCGVGKREIDGLEFGWKLWEEWECVLVHYFRGSGPDGWVSDSGHSSVDATGVLLYLLEGPTEIQQCRARAPTALYSSVV